MGGGCFAEGLSETENHSDRLPRIDLGPRRLSLPHPTTTAPPVTRLLSALAVLALAASAFAESLDPLLSTENLWALKQDEFLAAAGKINFQWTSGARDSARVAQKDLTAFGLPAVECVARFEGGKLNEII